MWCRQQLMQQKWDAVVLRTLKQEVGDDIEMRLCDTEGLDNEEVYVELVEIYVQ